MLALFPCMVGSAKTKKQEVQDNKENIFGDSFEAPCTMYDTDEEFAATGIFEGPANQKQELQKNALLAAQDLIRLKMKHTYKGMVSEYSASFGNNAGNDIERKMQSAGDRVIDVVVNETKQLCTKYSLDKFRVNMTCYVGIKISKSETVQRISNEIGENLTQEEKDRIGFNEQEYRKRMEKRFKEN